MGSKRLAWLLGAVLVAASGLGGAAAQSVTVIRGGAGGEAAASSVDVVRGRASLRASAPAAAPGIMTNGASAFVFAPGDVAFVNCPQGDGIQRASCRVRIAPPERKRAAF